MQPVTKDKLHLLTKNMRIWMSVVHSNKGNYVGSLGQLVHWLAERAEELEVEIYPGYPAEAPIYAEDDYVKGVITKDMGVAKD